jgi:hypothetical protein
MDATKCTCDVTDEIWTKDGNWFLYWEVCCLHKTRRYSSSSNFLPLPGACEVSWESITDYTEVDAGAADRAVATMKIVLESARLCKGRDEETVKKAVEQGRLMADQARESGAHSLTVTRTLAATICDCLASKSTK